MSSDEETVHTPVEMKGILEEVPDNMASSTVELNNQSVPQKKKNQMGTLMGVYVPCILSIWGVVMFIRIPWVIGVAGLIPTLLMLLVALLVVSLTTLSLSAISTNGDIKGGGAYYMISRALGPEFGGSIGLVFYLANIVSGGTTLIGFADSLVASVPLLKELSDGRWVLVGYAVGALFLLTLLSFAGAEIFSKANVLIFLAIWVAVIGGLSACAFREPTDIDFPGPGNTTIGTFTSWKISTIEQNLWSNFSDFQMFEKKFFSSDDLNLLVMFSILFPAVTGIMAGANMSGDLKNPGRSIPSGTLAAIFTTLVVYFFICIVCAWTIDRDWLKNDYFVLQNLSWSKWIVVQGIFAATLSSALGNIVGAARVLQAIARDELIPFLGIFKQGSAKGDEPQYAVIFSAFLMMLTCLVGDLDTILPIVTMFYLLTYGTTNFACFMLSITGAPNWRPLFRYFSKWASLLATLLCIISMFVLTPIHASVSMFLFLSLFVLIHIRAPVTKWGDITQALIYHQVRKYLLRLEPNQHVKFWRPSIIMLVDDLNSYLNLIDFGNNLKKGGLYILGKIVIGDHDLPKLVSHGQSQRHIFQSYIGQSHIKAFIEVALSNSFRSGASNLLTMAGIGGMRANTLMVKFWSELSSAPVLLAPKKEIADKYPGFESLSKEEYVAILNDAISLKKNVLIARNFLRLNKNFIKGFASDRRRKMTIDVWIVDQEDRPSIFTDENNTVLFSVQLGYILHCTDIWKKYTKLRVLSIIHRESDVPEAEIQLKSFLLRLRVVAKTKVVSFESARSDNNNKMVVNVLSDGSGSESDGLLDQEDTQTDNFMSDDDEERAVSIAWKKKYEDNPSSSSETKFTPTNSLINSIIKQNSANTAVLFVPFDPPSTHPKPSEVDKYIDELDILSDDLPPSILVHAIDSVIATEL
eukprot:TRINITY_DN1218_c4_g1_i1.p1 TRINITY_DN1218_c4_g1~~TRINITY_DN1218_c4_g1_i1.p1  ORF type:complete len:921 (-),score=198.95 TRINITY_DN1218_c4_g1_i1:102-2864(-)